LRFIGVKHFIAKNIVEQVEQSLDDLTRKHGIKVIPAERCSVENCTIAVAEVVGYSSILSAARMNSAVVIFFE